MVLQLNHNDLLDGDCDLLGKVALGNCITNSENILNLSLEQLELVDFSDSVEGVLPTGRAKCLVLVRTNVSFRTRFVFSRRTSCCNCSFVLEKIKCEPFFDHD